MMTNLLIEVIKRQRNEALDTVASLCVEVNRLQTEVKKLSSKASKSSKSSKNKES